MNSNNRFMCINELHGYKIQSIDYAQDKTKIYRKKEKYKNKENNNYKGNTNKVER